MTITPAEAFPPGEYLRDELEERGWTEREFAEILGRPVQAVSEILNGRKQIVPDTALAIGEALGTSADLWLNLQTAFNLYEARSRRPVGTDVGRRSRLRSLVPVAELRKLGWLPDTNDLDQLEESVTKLLGIASIDDEPELLVAARRSNVTEVFTPQQVAWLARVRQLAADRPVKRYDVAALTALASELVHEIHDPTDLRLLGGWLADCGVVLVNELPLRSSKLDGAVMMLDVGHPVVGLTTRGDRMDVYVFTLLHELAHLVLGHLVPDGIRIDENLEADRDAVASAAEVNTQAVRCTLPI
jgi:HTH-type transcriptional regulator/antitoxin HigA